jgi:hypothetical protein
VLASLGFFEDFFAETPRLELEAEIEGRAAASPGDGEREKDTARSLLLLE